MEGIRYPLALALAAIALSCAGCSRSRLARPEKDDKPTWVKPTWGPPAEGLQCRVRPARRVWKAQEALLFKVDLRNEGRRIFAFVSSEPLPVRSIIVDGRRHPLPRRSVRAGTTRPFAPGDELTDLTLTLPANVSASLSSGHHLVELVFAFEDVEVVSGPVSIEIVRGS